MVYKLPSPEDERISCILMPQCPCFAIYSECLYIPQFIFKGYGGLMDLAD